jgi:hypothetical protein
LPDFEGVRTYLNQALNYAVTDELAEAAKNRLDTLDLMVLLYKADVAASKDTVESLETALDYLKQSTRFEMDALQKERIAQKTAEAVEKLSALKAQATRAAEKAAEKTEAAE